MHTKLPRIHTTGPQGTAAFTMIELLAAITILMIIVSIMGVIFSESDRAWSQGTAMVERNTEGRAALNLLGHDLQYALADDVLTFAMRDDRDDLETFGHLNSEICFVSLSQRPEESGTDNARATQQIFYYVTERTADDKVGGTPLGRYQLMRTAINTDMTDGRSAYGNTLWYDQGANNGGQGTFNSTSIIAENVVALRFFAPNDQGDLDTEYLSEDERYKNRLPQYVDVFLEVMGEKDAIRAADLAERLGDTDPKVLDFVEKHSRRYTARVYFQNRAGYRKRA
jgi:type II secretory pathway component PulJ